jgi:CDP-glucose 4,6-dehydratase
MLKFYKSKRVLITGHTGFKGSWLSKVLLLAGAEVSGYSLNPEIKPNLFEILGIKRDINSITGDVRDINSMREAFKQVKPEIVFHLAAQPIVRIGYRDPVATYSTNVMGTVNFLECCRNIDSVHSILNVTTDKVYENNRWCWGYRETDALNGYDPYANSKSCSELVTNSYRNSFFENGAAVSTARAGNVIGGGDFSPDRIIPDCVRAMQSGGAIKVRNPNSIRPYQHVLEPLSAYLLIAQRQYESPELAGSYNVGPETEDCVTTRTLVDAFCSNWGSEAKWEQVGESGPHEDAILKLDCSLIKDKMSWRPLWDVNRAVKETVDWTKTWLQGENITLFTEKQIKEYLSEGAY